MRRAVVWLGLLSILLAWGLAYGQQGVVTGKALADTGKKLVDINTATPQELDALPGIGKAYTQAIILGRPYKNIRELRTRKIVPRGTYGKIMALITARPAKPEATPAEKPSSAGSGTVQPEMRKGPHKIPN